MSEVRLGRILVYSENLELRSAVLELPRMIRNDYKDKNGVDITNLNLTANTILTLKFTGKGASSDFNDNLYVMTKKNLYNARQFMYKISEWFHGEKYANLFVYSNNELALNPDFGDLTINTDYGQGKYILQATPVVIGDLSGRSEGVCLSFNKRDNNAIVKWSEFDIFSDAIRSFNFDNELLFLINSYVFCSNNARISTLEQERYQKALDRAERNPFN